MRIRALVAVISAALIGFAPAGTVANGTPLAAAGKVKCPIKASGSSSAVEWAFTESGAPTGAHPGVRASYTHGRGHWQSGHASGTVCHEDSLSAGGSHNLVLAVAGAARLSPGVTQHGLPGVRLALKVTVSASDDAVCAVGALGTVTLFASYHEAHEDSAALSFSGGCSDHNHRYSGSTLHVLIARGGKQVNSA
jgi:hypothetical protein